MSPALEIDGVGLAVGDGLHRQTILAPLSRTFLAGSFTAIGGPSGVGKTALLSILAGVVRPAGGAVRHGDVSVWSLDEAARRAWRRASVGLVFQTSRLIDILTAAEHMALVARLRGVPAAERAGCAWLERFWLGHRLGNRPAQLSGGEKQRVALAQALAAGPALVLADEPTAALDAVSAEAVAAALADYARTRRAVVVAVSHDPTLFRHATARFDLTRPHSEEMNDAK